MGKDKAHVGKMDAILKDSHLGGRINRRMRLDVHVLRLEYADNYENGTRGS